MKANHARALDTLLARDGVPTRVELRSGQVCLAYNYAWGRDLGTDVAHVTTNISPSPGEDYQADFFMTDEVVRIVDPHDDRVLFDIGGPS